MLQHILIAAETEAPNGWLLGHDINEVIWGTIAFLIIFGLLFWKAGPAIKAALQGRTDRLAHELELAATARTEAQAKLADVQHRIADAANERQRLLAEAATTGESVKAQVQAKADADAAALVARAAADIEASKSQALADLQSEAGALALGAAEVVVTRNLDAGTQSELIERYITQVGASR